MSDVGPGRPTQRQIAVQLGLSPATVSLALRDSPMIAAETRALVREAMRAAGYVPNAVAASLRTGRSRIVGVGNAVIALNVREHRVEIPLLDRRPHLFDRALGREVVGSYDQGLCRERQLQQAKRRRRGQPTTHE
jgi:hypothetical protein